VKGGPSYRRFQSIVDAFAGRRVVVLGDLVCDEFIHGELARVSREAPVLVLDQKRIELVPGGAGNAAANLRSLDAEPVPVGVIGRDDSGKRLLATFRRLGIPTSGIASPAGYATPAKSRILAGGIHTRRQQVVRLDRGSPRGDLSKLAQATLARRLHAALRGADGLLVADYGYGAATPSLVQGVKRSLGDRPVTVDSRARVGRYRGVTACTPNHEELEHAMGGPLDDERAFAAAGRRLREITGNRAVLVTRGAKGMALFERKEPARPIPAFGAGEVADVTGAGDTVVATFTLALIAGATFLEAATLANYAAGLVVMKYGTATVRRRELLAAIREDLAS
jgi:rfaE bifunctional protein kinase chain/domain